MTKNNSTEFLERKILLNLNEKSYKGKAEAGTQLAVVQWGEFKPSLEKRVYFVTKEGGRVYTKAKGLGDTDLMIIAERWGEINMIFNTPIMIKIDTVSDEKMEARATEEFV